MFMDCFKIKLVCKLLCLFDVVCVAYAAHIVCHVIEWIVRHKAPIVYSVQRQRARVVQYAYVYIRTYK